MRGGERLGDHGDAVAGDHKAIRQRQDAAIGIVALKVPDEDRRIVRERGLQQGAHRRGRAPRGREGQPRARLPPNPREPRQ